MRETRFEIVLCRSERDQLTLESLAATAEVHPSLVERFVEYGLLEPVAWVGPVLLFDAGAVPRLQMIMRLRRDTGVNLAGIGLILDLLGRLHVLECDNYRLQAQR
jgi:DNA-binding transcriptional MerR regulator